MQINSKRTFYGTVIEHVHFWSAPLNKTTIGSIKKSEKNKKRGRIRREEE